ncbi:cytosine permease [Thalassotalea litorea]|uniref:cytosine permease n=1 Tax=Thalassotalea litorea TaxID=2020715 RepID=UPI0037350875
MPDTNNNSTLETNDYATQRVPQSLTVNGFKIGMINGSLAFSVPGLITGIEVGNGLGFKDSMLAFFIGGLILSILGAITGLVGRYNRLTSCMTLKFVFGRYGADIISALFVLALLGWYGVNLDLFSASLTQLSEQLFAYIPPLIPLEIAIGVVITITTIWGFKIIEKISNYLVPIFFLLLLYMGYQSFAVLNWETLNSTGNDTMGFSEAIAIVVGSFIVSVVLMPDFSRFAKTDKDAVTASFLPFLGISSFVYIVSAIAGIAVGSNDILNVMLVLGLGSVALFLLIASSWITNVINLYSAALGTNAIINRWQEKHIVIGMGILGTVAASLNLLDRFTDFLFSLSIVFTPVAAIYVVDFFILRNKRPYQIEALEHLQKICWVAICAWIAGIMMAISVTRGYFTISGYEVIDALVISSLLYIAIKKLKARLLAQKQ